MDDDDRPLVLQRSSLAAAKREVQRRNDMEEVKRASQQARDH